LQSLDFAAQPGQSADIVLQLRNAGSIVLDVSLEPQRPDLFTVTPEQCEIMPGDLCDICVHFQAPADAAANVYKRSVVHKFCVTFVIAVLFSIL